MCPCYTHLRTNYLRKYHCTWPTVKTYIYLLSTESKRETLQLAKFRYFLYNVVRHTIIYLSVLIKFILHMHCLRQILLTAVANNVTWNQYREWEESSSSGPSGLNDHHVLIVRFLTSILLLLLLILLLLSPSLLLLL